MSSITALTDASPYPIRGHYYGKPMLAVPPAKMHLDLRTPPAYPSPAHEAVKQYATDNRKALEREDAEVDWKEVLE